MPKARREKFEAFLVARGAQLLTPTSEWEVIRFKTTWGTSVVYRDKRGQLTFTGQSSAAHKAFETNGPWRAMEATQRVRGHAKIVPMVRALLKRDGSGCFFCHLEMPDEDRSLEHLVAVTHGGPNHISNFVLAHRRCNAKVGHLSVMEKVRIREANAAALPELTL